MPWRAGRINLSVAQQGTSQRQGHDSPRRLPSCMSVAVRTVTPRHPHRTREDDATGERVPSVPLQALVRRHESAAPSGLVSPARRIPAVLGRTPVDEPRGASTGGAGRPVAAAGPRGRPERPEARPAVVREEAGDHPGRAARGRRVRRCSQRRFRRCGGTGRVGVSFGHPRRAERGRRQAHGGSVDEADRCTDACDRGGRRLGAGSRAEHPGEPRGGGPQ